MAMTVVLARRSEVSRRREIADSKCADIRRHSQSPSSPGTSCEPEKSNRRPCWSRKLHAPGTARRGDPWPPGGRVLGGTSKALASVRKPILMWDSGESTADPPDTGAGQDHCHAEVNGQFAPLERPVPTGRLEGYDFVVRSAELRDAVMERAAGSRCWYCALNSSGGGSARPRATFKKRARAGQHLGAEWVASSIYELSRVEPRIRDVRVGGKEREGSAVHLTKALDGHPIERKGSLGRRDELWQHEVIDEQPGCHKCDQCGAHCREAPADEQATKDAEHEREGGIAEWDEVALIERGVHARVRPVHRT